MATRTNKVRQKPKNVAEEKDSVVGYSNADILAAVPSSLHGITDELEEQPNGWIPLKLVAVYKFGLSITKLQFGPNGQPRVLPGVLSNVPGEPIRVGDGEQCIGFTQLKEKKSLDAGFLRVHPADASFFGLSVSERPVIMDPDGVLGSTIINVAPGTLGVVFHTFRRLEINIGFTVAYLEVTEGAHGS